MQTMMLLLIAAAPAQDHLEVMLKSQGAEYVAARARFLEEEGAAAELSARKRSTKYDAASWRADVILDAAELWLTRRADAERAYRLDGLDPAKYGLRRRPAPEAARELARLDVAPIAFELLLKTMDLYPVETAAERSALEEAAVIAIGESTHPAAEWALLEVARDERRKGTLRRLAARFVRSEAELTRMLSDRSPDLRLGAVLGLGQVRTVGSVEALTGALARPELRLAAIRALGSVASPRLLRREGVRDAERIRARASDALVDLLAASDANELGDALVETIGLIAHRDAAARISAVEGRSNPELIARTRRRLAIHQ